jgi:hypothetical protein
MIVSKLVGAVLIIWRVDVHEEDTEFMPPPVIVRLLIIF